MTAISTDARVKVNTGKTYRTWFGYGGGGDNIQNAYFIAQGMVTPFNSEFKYNNRWSTGNADVSMFFHLVSDSTEIKDERVSFIVPKANEGDIFITAVSENALVKYTQCTFVAMIYNAIGRVADHKVLTLYTGKSGSISLQDPNKPESTKIIIDLSVNSLFTEKALPVSISIK